MKQLLSLSHARWPMNEVKVLSCALVELLAVSHYSGPYSTVAIDFIAVTQLSLHHVLANEQKSDGTNVSIQYLGHYPTKPWYQSF